MSHWPLIRRSRLYLLPLVPEAHGTREDSFCLSAIPTAELRQDRPTAHAWWLSPRFLAVPAWYSGVEHPEQSRSFHEGRRGEMDRSQLRATTLCRLGMSAW